MCKTCEDHCGCTALTHCSYLQEEIDILRKALREIREGMATGLTTGQVMFIIKEAMPNPIQDALDMLGENDVLRM